MVLFKRYLLIGFAIAAFAGLGAKAQEQTVDNQPIIDSDTIEQSDTVQPLPPPNVNTLENALDPSTPNIANGATLKAYVDGVVATYMREDDIPGISLVIIKDGNVLYKKAYGIAGEDGRPVNADQTLFRIASISKTFTWTAMMQLYEQGLLTLDDDVNEHLPSELQVAADGFDAPIRIRHLMTHSAGWEDTAAGHLFMDDEAKILSLHDYVKKYRPARVREPGVSIAYSNYASAVAGAIIEHVSGQDFQSYVEEHITGPLAMFDTTFREPYAPRADLPEPVAADLARNFSKGMRRVGGRLRDMEFQYIIQIANVGGGSTTAADMARYMQMHLNYGELDGVRILADDTARLMQQTLFTGHPGVSGFAHGFMQYSMPGDIVAFGHGGSTSHFRSSMTLVPEHDLGIFVTTNTTNGGAFRGAFPRLFMERFFAVNEEHPTPPADFTTRGKIYAGTYMTDRHTYEGLEKLEMLFYGTTEISVDADGYLITSSGGETTAWVEVGPHLFREADGYRHIAFQADDDGDIIRFLPDGGTAAASPVHYLETARWFKLILALAAFTSTGCVMGAYLRRNRPIHESLNESVSSRLCAFMGLAWVVFFILFAVGMTKLDALGYKAMYAFPGPWLVAALAAALFGAFMMVINLPGLMIIWRDHSWPFWRRLRHSIAVLVSLALVLTLYHWNMLGFNYF